MEPRTTISPIDPNHPEAGVDFNAHPLALANEPGEGKTSNCFAESIIVETGIAEFACVCIYTCAHIAAGGELVWSYGEHYKRDGYTPGVTCDPPTHQQNPLDMLLQSHAHPDFKFVAVEMPDSSQDGSSEDSEYMD